MPLLPLCSQIYVGATVNSLLGDTFSRENNTHGSRLHDRDPQFASRILGAMTQSCYIGTRDIRSRVIRGPYCIKIRQSVIMGIFILVKLHHPHDTHWDLQINVTDTGTDMFILRRPPGSQTRDCPLKSVAIWSPPVPLACRCPVTGRSPRRRFPDHAFMLHCTFFPHLLAQQGSVAHLKGRGRSLAAFNVTLVLEIPFNF